MLLAVLSPRENGNLAIMTVYNLAQTQQWI